MAENDGCYRHVPTCVVVKQRVRLETLLTAFISIIKQPAQLKTPIGTQSQTEKKELFNVHNLSK